jgi:hypothetical protein
MGDVGKLGVRYMVDPLRLLNATTLANGGFSEWANYGNTLQLGYWEVMPVQAMASVTAGKFVTDYYATMTATGGTTTTAIGQIAAIATADLLKHGIIQKTLDATPTTAEEGRRGRITANGDLSTSGTITFTPAWGEAVANTDVVTVITPYKVVHTPGNVFARGVALATATVGQYFFVLTRGIYLNCVITADDDVTHGTKLMAGAAGIVQVLSGDTIPSVGICLGGRNTSDTSTKLIVDVNCN